MNQACLNLCVSPRTLTHQSLTREEPASTGVVTLTTRQSGTGSALPNTLTAPWDPAGAVRHHCSARGDQ